MLISEYHLEPSDLNRQTEPETPASSSHIIRYLRWAGSLLVILSAVGFMLQSHADVLPMYRYWVGLAIVLALCSCGVVCNYVLREATGARLFFALGAAFLPVQVSQVSAMLYAAIQGSEAPQPSYSWLQFTDVNPVVIGIDLAITALLLLSVNYTSFSMLAKRQVKTLMHAALLGNLCLLLPIRAGFGLAVMIMVLYVAHNVIERKLQPDNTMHLAEGVTARVLISLPLLIVLGRSVLYPLTIWVAVATIIALIGIIDVKRYTHSAGVVYMSQCLGTVAALSLWPMLVEHFVGRSADVYSLMVPAALMLFGLSTQVTYHARAYRSLSAIFATGLIVAALLDDQAFAPLLALSIGLALVTVGGWTYREKIPFFCGQLCFIGGISFYCGSLVDAYSQAPWIFTIVLGLAVLMLASILEKKQQIILQAVGHYVNALKSWH